MKAADTWLPGTSEVWQTPNTVRDQPALHEIQGLRDGIGDYASDRYHPVRVYRERRHRGAGREVQHGQARK